MKQNWYNRPRSFDKFTSWILTSPKALSVTMTMGLIVALIMFLLLFITSVVFKWGLFSNVIFFLVLALTIYNLYNYFRLHRKTGSIFDNTSISDILFNNKK
jgi:uncharacterized protein YacL